MLESIRNAITSLPMHWFRRNLGGRIPSCSRHVWWSGYHGNTRYLATACWIFSSYWRLGAKRMNHCGTKKINLVEK